MKLVSERDSTNANSSSNAFSFCSLFLGQLYGIEKFWAFMKYYKNSDQLEIGEKLNGYLNKFKTIDDFRVDEPEVNDVQGAGSLNKAQQQGGNKKRHRTSSENENATTTTAQNSMLNDAAKSTPASVHDV
jgi:hypothetical protein